MSHPTLAPTPTPAHALRGCALCIHGTGLPTQRRCTQPTVAPHSPISVVHARSNDGACGPEAVHLNFSGLYSPQEA